MQVSRSTDQPTALESEILAEKLAAYVRIARTLEGLVAAAQAARRVVSARRGIDRLEDLARFEELRRQAEQYFWYLIVQREALGLRRHEGLRQHYPIPAPVRDDSPPRGTGHAGFDGAAPTATDGGVGSERIARRRGRTPGRRGGL